MRARAQRPHSRSRRQPSNAAVNFVIDIYTPGVIVLSMTATASMAYTSAWLCRVLDACFPQNAAIGRR